MAFLPGSPRIHRAAFAVDAVETAQLAVDRQQVDPEGCPYPAAMYRAENYVAPEKGRHRSVLFGSEDTVTCISEAGNDIALLVEMVIHVGAEDVDVRVGVLQDLQSFRSGYDAEELD